MAIDHMTRIDAETLYGELWDGPGAAIEDRLAASLHPRSIDILYDRFADLGVAPGAFVLDIGGRDASHAIELVRRFDVHTLTVDPVPIHIERANAKIAEAGLAGRASAVAGRIEALPIEPARVDLIWCRDVLNHVDLPAGLAECFRVLRPGGGLLVYQTFATDLLEPNEARRLYESIAIVADNMSSAYFEAVAHAAKLQIVLHDVIDSEWRERWIEEGRREMLDDLLTIARIRRGREALAAEFGPAAVAAAEGGSLWGIYQMLGKLRPAVYLLRKPAP